MTLRSLWLILVALPGAAWGEAEILVHVDGPAARKSPFAQAAAESIAASVGALARVQGLAGRLGAGDTRASDWRMVVLVGAMDGDRRWQTQTFGTEDHPVAVDDLAEFLRTADVPREGWRDRATIPNFVAKRMATPLAVVRLTRERTKDRTTAERLRRRAPAAALLASAPARTPRRISGFEAVPWSDLPARLASRLAAHWPADLGRCDRRCGPSGAPEVWAVLPGPMPATDALRLPNGGAWLARDEGSFTPAVRRLGGEAVPVGAHAGVRLACIWTPADLRVVAVQGDRQAVTAVQVDRPMRLSVTGAPLDQEARWGLVADGAGEPADICALGEARTPTGCTWTPTRPGALEVRLVNRTPGCIDAAGTDAASTVLALTVKAARPVVVSVRLVEAACADESAIPLGKSMVRTAPGALCVGHRIELEPPLGAEARARALERVALVLRAGPGRVETGRPSALEGIVRFPLDGALIGVPLTVEPVLDTVRPVDVRAAQYRLQPGTLPTVDYELVTWLERFGAAAGMGAGLCLLVGLGWRGWRRWEQHQPHDLSFEVAAPAFLSDWRRRIARRAEHGPAPPARQPERDLPAVMRIHALQVQRKGRRYEVKIVPREGSNAPLTRICAVGDTIPWQPFRLTIQRQRRSS